MKKRLSLLLLLTLSLGLYACGNGEEEPTNGDNGVDMTPVVIELERHYQGMDFIRDGIGEADLAGCVDGDTSHFFVGNARISLRYLAVDTPESTFEFEPWGKAASDFVCDILTQADTIVLEARNPGDQDANGRYLGYVWVDGELLQLKIIREGFSRLFGTSNYSEQLFLAQRQAQAEGLRIHGQTDPLFENPPANMPTLQYLLENYEKYEYTRINITLTIVDIQANRNIIVMSDDSTSQTINLYYGPGNWTFMFENIGNILEFEELVPSYWQNSRQLVNYARNRTTLIFENN